jgi:hypothetical protein
MNGHGFLSFTATALNAMPAQPAAYELIDFD